ncbi:MAG: hypothetical protein J0I14_16940 [Propionibacteriaceae bacterium]|mgnify:FL=1|nr:hypothetical protein [Propionibacteriaceae bacterium]
MAPHPPVRDPRLPRLGVLYDPSTVDLVPLVRAGSGSWRTVWLVDRERLPADTSLRTFERFGELVDITGRRPAGIGEELDAPLDGLLASNDADLRRGADLASALGIRFATPAQAFRLTDKPSQRAAFRAAGIPSPEWVALAAGISVAEAVASAASLRFPVVLKPAQGSGSRYTRSVADPTALARALTEHGDALVEDLVLEERIPDGWGRDDRPWADVVSVESIRAAGRISHHGLTGRFALLPEFRETGNFVPAAVPPAQWPDLADLAEAAIRSLDPPDGAFHTEIKLSPDGPRVLEVNGRLGGGSLVWGTEEVTGRSLLHLAGRAALGLPIGPSRGLDPEGFAGVAFGRYYQPPLGAQAVLEVAGLDAARALPGVEDVIVFRQPGSPVDPDGGFMAHVCAVRGRAADHQHLVELVARIDSIVSITYA